MVIDVKSAVVVRWIHPLVAPGIELGTVISAQPNTAP
jgi:hypothetical protein